MIYKQSLIVGAAFILVSEFVLASMGAVIKTLSHDLPNESIVFFRNLFGLLVLLPFLFRGGLSRLRTGVVHLHAVRAFAGLAAMYCFFYAIGHMKLADAMLLKFTVPIFIPIVAYLWLSEQFHRRAAAALVLGFAGVVLILKPAGDVNWVLLIALAGSFFAAVAKTAVRRLSSSEPAYRVVFYFALIGVCVSAVPLAWAWQTPTAREWALLLSLGPLATVGQLLMTRGYAAAPASEVGLFSFSAVLYGAAYGWLFWGELWGWLSLLGAFLVASAGAMMLRGERDKAHIMTQDEQLAVPLVEDETHVRGAS
ncbi:MAG: DMT family transporter [Arenicellales bacterium]